MSQKKVVIFAEDPRLGRLLLREANAAGFVGIATTEPDHLEQHYRSATPHLTLMDVDGPPERVKRLLELARVYQCGRLVLLSEVEGAPFDQLMQLADAFGVSIHGTLHKPMEIEAIRQTLWDQKRMTSSPQARPKTSIRSKS